MKKLIWFMFVLAVLFLVPVAFAQAENPPIPLGDVTAARVIAIVAAGMALLFDYFPPLAAWFEKQTDSAKQLISVGAALGLVVLAFVLTCASVVTTNLVCTTVGAWDAVVGLVYLIIVQYAFHKATKPTDSLKVRLGISK
jgi:hypothetical protein